MGVPELVHLYQVPRVPFLRDRIFIFHLTN